MLLAKLKSDFKGLDADGSGFVTEKDLRDKAKEASYCVTQEEMDSIIKDMDENKDGKISLEEFIAASVRSEEALCSALSVVRFVLLILTVKLTRPPVFASSLSGIR